MKAFESKGVSTLTLAEGEVWYYEKRIAVCLPGECRH